MNNRAIKFRFWSRKNNCFGVPANLPSGQHIFWFQDKNLRSTFSTTYQNIFDSSADPNPGILISQFTGLKDSTGKDIYEGDIISYLFPLGTKHKLKVVVVLDNFHLLWEIQARYNNVKVIGNIFENPELLK